MKRLLFLLLCAGTLHAQTAITIQNPSFETHNTFTQNNPGVGYNCGLIPSWTVTGDPCTGSWQPSSTYYVSVPDGVVIAFCKGCSLSQDTGVSVVANTTYTLSAYFGGRGNTGTWTLSLYAGTTLLASNNGPNSAIPAWTFQQKTVTYVAPTSLPTGTIRVVLSGATDYTDFDNVSLTATTGPPPPFVWTMPGFGSFTFPMAVPPDCSDGSCSLVACNATTNVCVTITPGQIGSILFRKPSGDTVVVSASP